MLAIINAIKRFHVYLLGIHFKIITDCNSVTLTLQRKDINPRIARWAMFLQNYSYDIEHRPGSRMQHVDALSRCNQIMVLEACTFNQTLAIKQGTAQILKLYLSILKNQNTRYLNLGMDLYIERVTSGCYSMFRQICVNKLFVPVMMKCAT